jgi:S-adenosylmethionine hydrolase
MRPRMREVDPETLVKLELGKAEVTEGRVRAKVLHVDRFGNCITNLGSEDVPPWLRTGRQFRVRVGGRELRARFLRAYAEAEPGELLLTLGGTGFLEVSVNRGSAARELSLRIGSELMIENVEQER